LWSCVRFNYPHTATFYVTTTQKQSKPDQALETLNQLKPIPNLSFDPHLHQYTYLGKTVPVSTTSVLSFDMSEFTRQKIAETKHIWEPRGNDVHDYAEHGLRRGWKEPEGPYAEWQGALRDFPLWERYSAIATEYRLVDRRGRYAGSLDALLRGKDRDGKWANILLDFKTKSPSGTCGDHRAQLGAYCRMLNQWHCTIEITRCLVLNIFPGRVDLSVYSVQECTDAWDQRWKDYCNWKPDF
jgi:hypothetical protein